MKRYDIRTVMDFTSVPEDRLDACLADFRECVRYLRGVKAVAEDYGCADEIRGMGFQWADDGQVGLTGLVVEHVTAEGAKESEGAI